MVLCSELVGDCRAQRRYSTGPLIRNTYFEQGLNLITPADGSAISYFIISYYC